MEEGEPRFLGVTAEGGRKKKKKKKRSGVRQAFPPLFTAVHADNSFNYSKEFEPLRAGNVDSEIPRKIRDTSFSFRVLSNIR